MTVRGRRWVEWVRTLFATAFLAGLIMLSVRPLRPLPPLGPFLDPRNGVWSTAATAILPEQAEGMIPGLGGPVDVIYDDRAVPHIFGSSVEDVTRALGYVVARDRLFQLDLQSRATDGTLSEIAGTYALNADRQSRRLGLAEAARRNLEAMDPASTEYALLVAYADGINAWINGLGRRDLPFEYHLLGARPRTWEPVHSLYLLKQMSLTLAYSNEERRRLAAAALVGDEAADALFPVDAPVQQPIQPNGRPEPRFETPDLPAPGPPDTEARSLFAAQAALRPDWRRGPDEEVGEDVVGSNNWAAGPIKTASGHALLAGDPHLDLTLPSIWYEVHLVVPGQLDVYGVTIPGTPGVVIGFNRDVAWSFTNTGADVMDFYRERFDGDVAPRRYWLDGEWHDLRLRIETYRGPRGETLAVDTIYHTHRGPVVREGDEWWSMRWTVLEDQGEYEAFRGAATASTVDEWLDAMSGYVAPAQNGLVADRNGSIAIRSSARYPIRPGDGRGDVVRDGTVRASDWVGYWPVPRYPFAIDPGQGYLVSANQQPIDPHAEAEYLGADWPPPWRAIHINQLLREHDGITPDDFRRWQTDPGSARADVFVPAFLEAARQSGGTAGDTLSRAAELLSEWNRTYTREDERAILFEEAMSQLADATWDELKPPDDMDLPPVRPGSTVLAALLGDSASVWWDRRSTDQVELRDDILNEALRAGYRETIRLYGPPESGGWRWDGIRTANIFSLLRIDVMSRTGIPVPGGPSTISPLSGFGTHGASWRMVVDLGDSVRAWTIYPGGQSGNPSSGRYADRIPAWAGGELQGVAFPKTAADLPPERRSAELHLQGG